jgi:hypothetical protein
VPRGAGFVGLRRARPRRAFSESSGHCTHGAGGAAGERVLVDGHGRQAVMSTSLRSERESSKAAQRMEADGQGRGPRSAQPRTLFSGRFGRRRVSAWGIEVEGIAHLRLQAAG